LKTPIVEENAKKCQEKHLIVVIISTSKSSEIKRSLVGYVIHAITAAFMFFCFAGEKQIIHIVYVEWLV